MNDEQTSFSSSRMRSDLVHFLIVPSSWKREVGIGPIGYDNNFSTVTSSLQLVKAKARQNMSSGLMLLLIISPDLHLNFVFLCMSAKVFIFDR